MKKITIIHAMMQGVTFGWETVKYSRLDRRGRVSALFTQMTWLRFRSFLRSPPPGLFRGQFRLALTLGQNLPLQPM